MSDNLSSQRQLRFSELIRSLISECLLVEDFYNLSFKITSITISYVKMSKDLRIANVYAQNVQTHKMYMHMRSQGKFGRPAIKPQQI